MNEIHIHTRAGSHRLPYSNTQCTLWWTLIGLTLRYVAMAMILPGVTTAGSGAIVCSLAPQALLETNTSRSTTQLLDCKHEGFNDDPHTLYKTIVLAGGWLLGMLLVSVSFQSTTPSIVSALFHLTFCDHAQSLIWALTARRLWEIHCGNSPEVEKLLRELASYPNTRGKQVRRQETAKVGPAPTQKIDYPRKGVLNSITTASNKISDVNSEPETVEDILDRLGLISFLPAILDIGGTSMVHLAEISDEDLQTIGMKPLHRRSLLQALSQNNF